MKKSQLEEEIRVLKDRIRKMEEDRKAMLKKTGWHYPINYQPSSVICTAIGRLNAKFVKMYIKEMLDKGILTIDAKTSEGGYFNIDVMFDGQCIASTDGQICMDRFFS